MGKENAAKVIDLQAFREKKKLSDASADASASAMPAAMLVPVWFCWVPVWAPVMP